MNPSVSLRPPTHTVEAFATFPPGGTTCGYVDARAKIVCPPRLLIPSGFPIPTCTPSRKDDSDYDPDIPADLDKESVDSIDSADEMGEDTAAPRRE